MHARTAQVGPFVDRLYCRIDMGVQRSASTRSRARVRAIHVHAYTRVRVSPHPLDVRQLRRQQWATSGEKRVPAT